MNKKKFKEWCKEHKKVLIGGGIIVAGGCIGVILGTVFKPDKNIDPFVIDLDDPKYGILGKMLKTEQKSGWECFVYDEAIKIKDLGEFGEKLLLTAPEGITLETGVNGVMVMTDHIFTE